MAGCLRRKGTLQFVRDRFDDSKSGSQPRLVVVLKAC
jgi:hypothetical protein